jgi:hypothetical protein
MELIQVVMERLLQEVLLFLVLCIIFTLLVVVEGLGLGLVERQQLRGVRVAQSLHLLLHSVVYLLRLQVDLVELRQV